MFLYNDSPLYVFDIPFGYCITIICQLNIWLFDQCLGRHELALGNTFVAQKDLQPPNKEVPPEVFFFHWILTEAN